MPNFKLSFYVPEADCESVKAALFASGAGTIGNYDCCAWQTLGTGQFRPLEGSHPTVGSLSQLETVSEFKVEMLCHEDVLQEVIATLKIVHPYEEPAYDVIQCIAIE